MREKIFFTKNDRIAIIAPHPDDECMFAAGVLLLAAIVVLIVMLLKKGDDKDVDNANVFSGQYNNPEDNA